MTERTRAVLCVYDRAGRVLMQHRSYSEHYYPGYWGFFGGPVDGDEKPEQTVRREIYRQAGYQCHRPVFFIKEKEMRGGLHALTYIYLEPYDEFQPIILQEGREYGWFNIDDALNLRIPPARYKTLRKIARRLRV